MNLLTKSQYKQIENNLRNYKKEYKSKDNRYDNVVTELKEFFNNELYLKFIDVYYINRYEYKHRYPTNRLLFRYLQNELFVQESTLYAMRKEIMYKAAMLFYKYNLLIK